MFKIVSRILGYTATRQLQPLIQNLPRGFTPRFYKPVSAAAMTFCGALTTPESRSFTTLTCLLLRETSQHREYLKALQQNLNECFNSKEIQKTCFELFDAYSKEGNLDAGYHLLHLLDIHLRLNLSIPEKGRFFALTAREVLNSYFEKELSTPTKENSDCITMIRFFFIKRDPKYYGENPPSLYELLLETKTASFLEFVRESLLFIPSDLWDDKGTIILSLLTSFSFEEQKKLAKDLSTSKDLQTKITGDTLSDFLKTVEENPQVDLLKAPSPAQESLLESLNKYLPGYSVREHLYKSPPEDVSPR